MYFFSRLAPIGGLFNRTLPPSCFEPESIRAASRLLTYPLCYKAPQIVTCVHKFDAYFIQQKINFLICCYFAKLPVSFKITFFCAQKVDTSTVKKSHNHSLKKLKQSNLESTMTAWADIQDDWAKNTDEKCMTGVLLWDFVS